jgi:hypothetical protein
MIPRHARPRERRTKADRSVALARSLAAWGRPEREITAALGGASITDIQKLREEDRDDGEEATVGEVRPWLR